MILSRSASLRHLRTLSLIFLLLLTSLNLRAASVHGRVTDSTGARVTGAKVTLFSGGKAVATTVSAADGSFQLTTGETGRMFLLIVSGSFRQLETQSFYAGRFDAIERNLVLQPEWVRSSIVVTATGTPTPQPQTSAATTVLGPEALATWTDLNSSLRTVPGVVPVQAGQRGAQTSLFIRGGSSTGVKNLIDGVDAGDLGNQLDFGLLPTSGIESVEIYRGPNSSLFGAGAVSGVLSITTPRGTTHFPSILFSGDAGNFNTSHEQLTLAGAHKKLDYLGSYSWLQTSNALPRDQHRIGAATANLGWQPTASTQLRGTLHYGVSASGNPNAWDFYHVADNATEKDQNLLVSASLINQTTDSFQNTLRYGATRKREQIYNWGAEGNQLGIGYYATYGNLLTLKGANGYTTAGQAALDYSLTGSANYFVNNRDAVNYQGNLTITPHLVGMIGFAYENERGTATYYSSIERNNYDYSAAVHGDYKTRFFYTLGGSLEHYSAFGTETTPRAGVSFYALRPRSGIFSGTRILFNYGDAVREPRLTDQDYSLYTFLNNNGGQSTIQQLNIKPLAAPRARTYEAGFEQTFLSSHVVFRSTYFHNQFNRELESVGVDLLPELLPNLTPAQVQSLMATLYNDFAYSLTLASGAFRAQGVETSVETGIGANLFFRGGYTYLDAVVQRSFTSDNESLLNGTEYLYTDANGKQIAVGAYTPLTGARPFRRPPHTGFFTATYTGKKLTGQFASSFASRSDDTTFLTYAVVNGSIGNMLLPNRNLNHGYAKLDLGGSYQLTPAIGIYTQLENVLSQQHIGPIGYPSLPATIRTGLRFAWGPGSSR